MTPYNYIKGGITPYPKVFAGSLKPLTPAQFQEALIMARRTALSLKEKVNLLNEIERESNTSHRFLSKKFGLSKSYIGKILSSKETLRRDWAKCTENGQGSPDRKRQRDSKDSEVDEALKLWFTEARSRGLPCSGPLLRAKAEDLAKKLGKTDFVASDGWLTRWKARHGILHKRMHGEKQDADTDAAKDWTSSVLPELLSKYGPDDIYNADETGLYYRATPDGTLAFKEESVCGSKKAMDRVTALVCSNMSGTDKKKLMIIGKSANPRCFKGIKVQSLPVDYKHNKNAWMTSSLFTEWIEEWDKQLRRERRKILLLVDNCSAHPRIPGLTNIELHFLPPNTTSIIQPMDQGVIKNLKTLYRKEVLSSIISEMDDQNGSNETAVKIARQISILSAIYMIAKSWDSVTSTTISNCFRKGGLIHHGEEVPQEGVEELPEEWVLEETYGMDLSDFTAFVNFDKDIQCSSTCTEADIVETITAKRARIEAQADEEEEEEQDEDPVAHVTFKEAAECMTKVRQYLCQLDDTDPKTFTHLFAIDKRISESRKLQQSKIKTFFSKKTTTE